MEPKTRGRVSEDRVKGLALRGSEGVGRPDSVLVAGSDLLSSEEFGPLGLFDRVGSQPRPVVVGRFRRWVSVLVVADLLGLVVAVGLSVAVHGAVFARSGGPVSLTRSLSSEAPYSVLYLLVAGCYGLYGRVARRMCKAWYLDLGRLVHALVTASLLSLAVSAGASRLVGGPELGWVPTALIGAMGVVTLPVSRAVFLRLIRAGGRARSRVLVVGSGPLLPEVAGRLGRMDDVEWVGIVADEPAGGLFHALWVGPPADLPRLCEENGIDRVLVGLGADGCERAMDGLRRLPDGVQVAYVSGSSELLTWQSQVEDLGGLTLLDVAPARRSRLIRMAKRAVDIVATTLLLLLLLPVMVLIAVAIKATSPGPVLFRQERVGLGRQTFRICKFRTMRVGAEELRLDLLEANEADGPLFKLHRDPRVTAIGGWLRRTSLDELPQLLNVLSGRMSLVGPRPFVAEESVHLDGWASRRFLVRPGITGLWQVCGRSDLSFEELRRLDYAYAASWSLGLDMRILCQTFGAVLKGRGAY